MQHMFLTTFDFLLQCIDCLDVDDSVLYIYKDFGHAGTTFFEALTAPFEAEDCGSISSGKKGKGGKGKGGESTSGKVEKAKEARVPVAEVMEVRARAVVKTVMASLASLERKAAKTKATAKQIAKSSFIPSWKIVS